MAALLRIIARRPVVAFMVIGLGAYFLTVEIPPIVNAQVLPFALPLHGVLGGALGVGVGAFVVTGALAGRDGVVDLARRSLRWWVPVRWYLIALFTVPLGATLISLAIYGPQGPGVARRWLAAGPGGGSRCLPAAASAVSACRGDRIHRVPPTSLARPVSPHETHPVRGAAVGAMAPARPLRRGRLGSRGADLGPDHLRRRVRLVVLRP